jgi:anaerobic selenocysteine-containing dehydrogenase
MRKYGVFEIEQGVGRLHEQEVSAAELDDVKADRFGRAYTKSPRPVPLNIVPQPTPENDEEGRRPVGVLLDNRVVRGFPTPSGKLEFYSRTLVEWGWPEQALPGYIKSHVHPDNLEEGQIPLIPTFRLPVQIHTRSGNAKWLDEIAHTNPLWIHTDDAERLDVRTGELVRVETQIGYFVVKAWVTEGIRPGVVACSHHMGRWRLNAEGQRQIMALVDLEQKGSLWRMHRKSGVEPYGSSDPDTLKLWWSDVGVHQNITFPVQPDPISGMHCWHQAVRITKARHGDRYGDIEVDTGKAHEVFRQWLALTRSALEVSPDGTRRPYWLMRPLKPARDVYRLPATSVPKR